MNRGKYQCSIPQRLEGEAAEKYLGFEGLQPFWLINASKNGGQWGFLVQVFHGGGWRNTVWFEKKLSMCDIFWVVATQIFFIFTPKIGEDFQFDEHIFQTGWNHQLWFWMFELIWVLRLFFEESETCWFLFSPKTIDIKSTHGMFASPRVCTFSFVVVRHNQSLDHKVCQRYRIWHLERWARMCTDASLGSKGQRLYITNAYQCYECKCEHGICKQSILNQMLENMKTIFFY